MILADNETKIDLLNNEAIAATIIKLLRDRHDQPVTVGVHGDWGAGKSSILEMIEAKLEDEKNILCLKFNGWRFQGFEDAKIALIEGIVTGLIEKRPVLANMEEAVKDVFHRIDWLKVAKSAGGLAFTAFTGIPTSDQIQAIASTVEGFLAEPSKLTSKANIETGLKEIKGLLKPKGESGTTNVPEEINAFRKAFNNLLCKAGIEQLVVLIDDLDRCLPDIAIETLEAVRLFVFTPRTAFVVAADETMIEYAVRRHFPDLPDTTGPQTYAKNYLEKLIQIPFRIPALGDTETRIYVTLLLVGAALGEDHPAFSALLEVARERLKCPWKSGALDAATLNATLGKDAAQASNALMLSDQIGPILASGTHGNPRQIKRFLNTLILRQGTAEARGFGSDIKLPVLAKLMLAEQFIPRLFEQIAFAAAAASDGKCPDLTALEAIAAKGGTTKEAKAKKVSAEDNAITEGTPKLNGATKATDSPLLSEWLSSSAIMAWAAVPTALGGEDLRPYLFVAKDRKDYFGTISALGYLSTIVDQLLGSRLAVYGLLDDLKRLTQPEAAQIFEAVRGRIIGGDSFSAEPAGIAGLGVLVKAHPTLQNDLLNFLEILPCDRLGPWVCKGWTEILKDTTASQHFNQLLQTWSARGDTKLKTAAQNVLRTRQGVH